MITPGGEYDYPRQLVKVHQSGRSIKLWVAVIKMSPGKIKVTFMLYDDLYEWVKQRAAKRRTTVTTVVKDMVIDGIEIYKIYKELDQHKRQIIEQKHDIGKQGTA